MQRKLTGIVHGKSCDYHDNQLSEFFCGYNHKQDLQIDSHDINCHNSNWKVEHSAISCQ